MSFCICLCYIVIQTYIICILISFFLISVVPFVIKTPIKITTTTTLKIKTHNNTTRSCFQLNNLFNWIELNVFESQIQLRMSHVKETEETNLQLNVSTISCYWKLESIYYFAIILLLFWFGTPPTESLGHLTTQNYNIKIWLQKINYKKIRFCVFNFDIF